MIYETSALHFFVFTVLICGAASFQTGRAVAQSWQPAWYILFYAVLLTATVRFMYFAMLQQSLLSVQYFVIDLCVLVAAGYLGWRLKRNHQMAKQYGCLNQS